MLKGRFSTLFGAAVIAAVVAVPARAADDIASQAEVCSTCHGQNGQPSETDIPIIWGQQQSYLVKQLHDYRSGDRSNEIMASVAKTIKQEDIRKMAAYFAGKTWPPTHAAGAPPAAPEGIAICKACHQENFQGGPPAPRLAGLSYEYLVDAMRSFANDERTNNLDMPKFMKDLSDSQREAIARYLSAL